MLCAAQHPQSAAGEVDHAVAQATHSTRVATPENLALIIQ
jgi:hypothetical protein